MSDSKKNLDFSYINLKSRISDLDRLCEILLDLVHDWNQNPTDLDKGSHVATIAEITQDRMREFKDTYDHWYETPLKEGDDYVIIPSVSRRRSS